MLNLNNLDFTAMEVSERNYLKWVQDMKLHLTAKRLRATIEPDNEMEESDKITAMIFIRRHVPDIIQMEYHAKEDPRALGIIF